MESAEYKSTVEKWPGYILLPEYMTFKSLLQWEKVVRAVGDVETQSLSNMADGVIPFLCEFVKEWHIDKLPIHVTPDDLPGSPALLNWLIESVNAVFTATNEPDPLSLEQSSNT